jgi:hypothetical protein
VISDVRPGTSEPASEVSGHPRLLLATAQADRTRSERRTGARERGRASARADDGQDVDRKFKCQVARRQ